jgi:hypothetical protein
MSETADGPVSLSAIGAVSGVLVAVVLAVVTVQTVDGVGIAALIGVLSGTGAYLLIPYLVRLDRYGQGGADEGGRVNEGAAGAALAASGVVVLALLLIFEDPLLAAGIGLPLTVLEFVIWSLALPRAATEPGAKKPIHRRG